MNWTMADAAELATAASLDRGLRYADEGRVVRVLRSGDSTHARVKGTTSYAVWLSDDDYHCDCPIGVSGEFCKHLVALVTTLGDEPAGPIEPDPELSVEPQPLVEPAETRPRTGGRRTDDPLAAWLTTASRDELADALRWAAAESDVVRTHFELLAARKSGDLTELTRVVDQQLRSRRYLDYRDAMDYARDAQPVVDELAQALVDGQAGLVPLLERAIGHASKVCLRADDSSGLVGDLVRDLLDLHRRTCAQAPPPPAKLVKWMVSFGFAEPGFWQVDIVDYASALGDEGMAKYRAEVDRRVARGDDSFAVNEALRRLAVLDRDVDRIVQLVGGDLTAPYQFQRVSDALLEMELPDESLHWAERGVAETSGWQVHGLYDRIVAIHKARGEDEAMLRTRQEQFRRMPSLRTFGQVRKLAGAQWPGLRADALATLLAGGLADDYVMALISEGHNDEAWEFWARQTAPLRPDTIRAVADARAQTAPNEALPLWLGLVHDELRTADRGAYLRAADLLRHAARHVGEDSPELVAAVGRLREQHRRRPTFIQILERAGW